MDFTSCKQIFYFGNIMITRVNMFMVCGLFSDPIVPCVCRRDGILRQPNVAMFFVGGVFWNGVLKRYGNLYSAMFVIV